MPRNKSELIPEYSPAVTAWLITWYRLCFLDENCCAEEEHDFRALTYGEKSYWGQFGGNTLEPLARKVYDAQKQE